MNAMILESRPVSVFVVMMMMMMKEARESGTWDGQRERRNYVTSFKQVWMITHLRQWMQYVI